jgi:hypothetical protein
MFSLILSLLCITVCVLKSRGICFVCMWNVWLDSESLVCTCVCIEMRGWARVICFVCVWNVWLDSESLVRYMCVYWDARMSTWDVLCACEMLWLVSASLVYHMCIQIRSKSVCLWNIVGTFIPFYHGRTMSAHMCAWFWVSYEQSQIFSNFWVWVTIVYFTHSCVERDVYAYIMTVYIHVDEKTCMHVAYTHACMYRPLCHDTWFLRAFPGPAYVCMYVCMYLCVYIYTHTHIYMYVYRLV